MTTHKPKKASPTVLSLDFLNKCGHTCQIVEKWNSFAKVRQDLFGFGDILTYSRQGISLVQTTTDANYMARRAKILKSPHYAPLKAAGMHILLHGWGKNGLRGEEL